MSDGRVLVVDVGTSGVRAAVVGPERPFERGTGPERPFERGTGPEASVAHVARRRVLPSTPAQGFVEFDAAEMAAAALDVAREAMAAGGPVAAVGITNQRASTVVWDRATGEPVGPGIGWQDLRTVGMCLALKEDGVRVAPNQSATKLGFLLDTFDPDRNRDLCFGTVDTWIAWTLSRGQAHVTDPSNAGVTGLFALDGSGWDPAPLSALRIPESVLPKIVDSSGVCGEASVLEGAPVIAGIVGDQQASLAGQGCVMPGLSKITFGTGGMLDLMVGAERPSFARRGDAGCFPIAAWRRGGELSWGIEAIMLTAGQAVEWLVEELGLLASAAESEEVAARCSNTADVWFVPALLGMATPAWDFGARGTLVGVSRGAGKAEVVRAVLEGVAHRGADLVDAAEADSGLSLESLRVDGGMSANAVFVQALADAARRPVEVSPVLEATTLGAAFLAGLAVGIWSGWDEIAATWKPARVVEPRRRPNRDRWREACDRARRWVPELSSLDF